MNQALFEKLTKAEASPLLEGEFGFAFEEGMYYRNLASGVRHAILFDFDIRSKRTFRVMAGLNSALIYGDTPASQAGIFCVRHLNTVGFADRSTKFPCFDDASAKSSLRKIGRVLVDSVLPWLANVLSIKDLADCVEEHYPFVKGKLYCLAGDNEQARDYLSRHLSYLAKQTRSEEIDQAFNETRLLLQRCERPSS